MGLSVGLSDSDVLQGGHFTVISRCTTAGTSQRNTSGGRGHAHVAHWKVKGQRCKMLKSFSSGNSDVYCPIYFQCRRHCSHSGAGILALPCTAEFLVIIIIIKLKAKLQITEIMLYRIRRCKIHLSPSVIIDKKWSIQHRLKQMYDTNIRWVVSGILDSIVHKSKTTSRCLCLTVVITVIFPRMQFWMLNQMCSLFIIVAC